MITDDDEIKQLVYDLLDAVERMNYGEDAKRVKKILIDKKVIKDNGG